MGAHRPDPIASRDDGIGPEQEALLADSVGLALLVVLETLAPAKRFGFVPHELFAAPFEAIALIVGRSPTAARKLASRAHQRVVVDAFLAAARGGDFGGLLAVLDPDVVLRADDGAALAIARREVHGATVVADEALTFSRLVGQDLVAQPALVNGAVGRVVICDGQPFSVMGFIVAYGTIVAIDILADPERLLRLDLSVPDV